MPARIDHSVDRTGATQSFTSNPDLGGRETWFFSLLDGELPGEAGVLDQFCDALGHSHVRMPVVTACFQHKYPAVWVFRESVSQYTASRTCPYNNVVIIVDSSPPPPIKQRMDGFAKVKPP